MKSRSGKRVLSWCENIESSGKLKWFLKEIFAVDLLNVWVTSDIDREENDQ